MYEIRFPHLGIVLKHVADGFSIGGFEIRFYGMIIALGFVLGYLLIAKEAKRTNQDGNVSGLYVMVGDPGDSWGKNILCHIQSE